MLTYTAAIERIAACLEEHVEEVAGPMKILEAGCGRRWEIDLEPSDYELTGVDLDRQALDLRQSVMGDLDLAVVGDICDRGVVPSNHFDVIYSSYVLEHIEVATTALDNFLEWACPGGLIVMLLPNRDSVYCWAARLTPYRLHEWVYRYVFRVRPRGSSFGHIRLTTTRCSRQNPLRGSFDRKASSRRNGLPSTRSRSVLG